MAKNKKIAVPHNQDNRPVTTLVALYEELNIELFHSRLHHSSEVKLEWMTEKDNPSELGNITLRWTRHPITSCYVPLRGSVLIRIREGQTPRQTRKTMAHEMAHLAAAMHGTLKHDATFWGIMASIGYGKHHHFEDAGVDERDIYTCKSENRKAVWFWRSQPIGTAVLYKSKEFEIECVQPRGTKVLIRSAQFGYRLWVEASAIKVWEPG